MDLLRANLSGAGHECFVVPNGEQALSLMRQARFDLLVLDIMLPGGISGFEVCRRIRGDSEINFLPILVLSAMSGHEEIMHGLAQGADDYLAKPFEVQQFLGRVENLLKMTSDSRGQDELTSLPGPQTIKREIQKRLTRKEVFSLVSIEPLRLREFAYHCGLDARQKAIRHLARAARLCGQDTAGFEVGHMGGGYFISLVSHDIGETYSRRVLATWDTHLPALYESMGFGKSFQGAVNNADHSNMPILKLLLCLTTCNRKEAANAKDLFEVLTRLRSNALNFGWDGIHIDRRS
jgi:CheY-like chemotaxis protein